MHNRAVWVLNGIPTHTSFKVLHTVHCSAFPLSKAPILQAFVLNLNMIIMMCKEFVAKLGSRQEIFKKNMLSR